MKIILIIAFGIMFCLKLASVGVMANSSWWVVFSPLIASAVWWSFWFILGMVALAGIFPSLTYYFARYTNKR